jgi:hypothetical protein
VEWIAILLLKLRIYDRVLFWCKVAKEMFPADLATYTMQLKLYFSMEDREKFFEVTTQTCCISIRPLKRS